MASHLSPGAFVGIGLAMLFVLLVLLWLLLRLCCYKCRHRMDAEAASSPSDCTISAYSLSYGCPLMLAEIDGQTVNPKDVWKPTDLERFASPVAGMLQPPVILQGAQKCMTSMGESSTHHETEISILGSSPEATTEDTTIALQTTVVEKHSLAKILPAHTKDPKNSRVFSPTSANQQPAIPTFACEVAGCTRTFNKQYELNHHMRYHTKQKVCETCQASFGTVTHLERHINSVHQTAKVYHCTVAGCNYFKTANPPKSFSRKDNWRRHMIEQHGSGQGDDLGAMDF